jgi:hypothetical protein
MRKFTWIACGVVAAGVPRIVLWLVPDAVHTGAWAAAPVEFPRRVLGWFAAHQSGRGVNH